MLILNLSFFSIVNCKENILKINITAPYGENFYYLTYQNKI